MVEAGIKGGRQLSDGDVTHVSERSRVACNAARGVLVRSRAGTQCVTRYANTHPTTVKPKTLRTTT